MKKIALAAMILGMASVLGACSMGGDGASETTGGTIMAQETDQEEKGQKEKAGEGEEQTDTSGAGRSATGIVSQEDQFFELMSAGYEAVAEDLGYETQSSNVTSDQMKETELVNTCTARGVAGIATSPLSVVISPETLKVSSNKGVKIRVANTAMDSYPFSITAYASNNYAFCRQTGEITVDFTRGKYGDEKIRLGILQSKTQIPETSAERVNGFLAALDEGGANYETVSNQDTRLRDTAITKAGDMLATNPNTDIMFAANDGKTISAVMAVEDTGQVGKTFVFGTDASEQIVGLLKADNGIFQTVTGQDPFQIGYKTVETLVQSIEGKDVADQRKTVIVEDIPLGCGDIRQLDDFMSGLRSKTQLNSLPVKIRSMP